VIAREQLRELLAGGVDREVNIISALVDTVTRLAMQELLEGEQADLGGRAAMSVAVRGSSASATVMSVGGCGPPPRARSMWRFRKVRDSGEPFRSSLMSLLDGNSEVLHLTVGNKESEGCWSEFFRKGCRCRPRSPQTAHPD
jgi:hypothetical protein